MYDAEGVSLQIHSLNFDTAVGAGIMDGHLTAGGHTLHDHGPARTTLGQQSIPLNLPTDVFETGHLFSGIGFGYRTKMSDETHGERQMDVFGGLASTDGGTPLFASNETSFTPAAIFLWKRPVWHGITATTSLMASKKLTAIESLEWKPSQNAHAAVSFGMGSNAAYAAASYAIERRDLQILAEYVQASPAFQRLINPSLLSPPEPARENISARYHFARFATASAGRQNDRTADGYFTTVNTAGFELGGARTGVGVNLYQSSYDGLSNTSTALTMYREQGRLRLTGTLLHSALSVGSSSTMTISTAAVRITPRFRFTESISTSSGVTNFSHGGELQWAFGAVRVESQLFYMPTQPARPFQQALVFDVQQRVLPRLTIHAASFVSPNGSIQYTFEMGTLFGGPSGSMPASHSSIGLQVILGLVVDTSGQPVEGAALMIGQRQIYTDSTGSFILRLPKSQTLPVRVLTGEFLSGGSYRLVEAPQEVESRSEEIARVRRIVVQRTEHGGEIHDSH